MYYYIVNPAAGGGAIDGIQDRLKASLMELKIDGEFAKTLGEGDAGKVTANALSRGYKTIVAVGGGKTVNEIINTVYKHRKKDVAVGIIPIGKHNILAHSLGIENWRQACEVLASRRLIEYSLIAVNDYVLIQTLAIAPSLPKQEESQEEPTPAWKKIFHPTAPSAQLPQIHFKAQLNNKLKIRGQAEQIEIYNQKFLYPELENDLLIQIHSQSSASPSGLWHKLNPGFNNNTQTQLLSQLHTPHFGLKTQGVCEANLDGQLISAKQFNVSLTDWKLRMITNLPR